MMGMSFFSLPLILGFFFGLGEPREFEWSEQTKVVWPLKADAITQSAAVSFSDWGIFFPETASDKAGVRAVLNQMAGSGIQTVWWRTTGGGWVHYASQTADATYAYYPGFDQSYGEIDPLAEAVSYAHELGLKIAAWYTPLEEAHGVPESSRSHYVDAHPELMDINNQGQVAGAPSFYFDAYRQYKVSLGLEMIQRYQTDALVIDFERRGAPGRNDTWGYLPEIIAGFQSETGIDPTTLPTDDEQWQAYRARYIGMFMEEMHNGIQQLDRDVELIVLFPWQLYLTAHCNIPEWVENGWIDRVVLRDYGSEGWGWTSDGTAAMAEWETLNLNVPVGFQCYAYNPEATEMVSRVTTACQQGYDDLVWFETTPLKSYQRYHVPREIALSGSGRILSPEVDLTGGGEVVVLGAGDWSLRVDGAEQFVATGRADIASRVILPACSGMSRISVECSLDSGSQKGGVAVQGYVINASGEYVDLYTDMNWTCDAGSNQLAVVGQPGVPPFLGERISEYSNSLRPYVPQLPSAELPATRAYDPAWQGKWIWGARKPEAPVWDVNLYEYILKFPGGWGQALVNRLVGNAAAAGLDKIYWRLDDGHGRLLFPSENYLDKVLNWPNWNVYFGAVDMPALGMALAGKCGMSCTLVVDSEWKEEALAQYPSATVLTPEEISGVSSIEAVYNTGATSLARTWLLRDEYYFRRTFDITQAVSQAEVCITAQDIYDCYFDGERLGGDSEWTNAETYTLGTLQPGTHVLAVKVVPGDDLSGLLVNMKWTDESGNSGGINSDENWKISSEVTDEWISQSYDDSLWSPVSIVGIEGIGSRYRLKEPWRNVQGVSDPVVVNLTRNTALFVDDFEGVRATSDAFDSSITGYAPEALIGGWVQDGTYQNQVADSDVVAFEGTQYLRQHRTSTRFPYGDFEDQNIAGDVLRFKIAANIDSGGEVRFLKDGALSYTNYFIRTAFHSDGKIRVENSSGGFVDTGLTYTPNEWGVLSVNYTVGATRYSVDYNGQAATVSELSCAELPDAVSAFVLIGTSGENEYWDAPQVQSVPIVRNLTTGEDLFQDGFEEVLGTGDSFSSLLPGYAPDAEVGAWVQDGTYQNQVVSTGEPGAFEGMQSLRQHRTSTHFPYGDIDDQSTVGNVLEFQIAFNLSSGGEIRLLGDMAGPSLSYNDDFIRVQCSSQGSVNVENSSGSFSATGLSYDMNVWNTLSVEYVIGTDSYVIGCNGSEVNITGLGPRGVPESVDGFVLIGTVGEDAYWDALYPAVAE